MIFKNVRDIQVSEEQLEMIEAAIHRIVDTGMSRDFYISYAYPTDTPNVYEVKYRIIGRIDAKVELIRTSRRTF